MDRQQIEAMSQRVNKMRIHAPAQSTENQSINSLGPFTVLPSPCDLTLGKQTFSCVKT